MRARLLFLARYLLFWTALFLSARVLFLAYEHDRAAALDAATLLGTMLHGARMDVAAAAYLTILPLLLIALSVALGARVGPMISAYTVLVIVIVAGLVTTDLELFRAWGFRLDATPLQFIHTPREMAASAEAAPLWRLVIILLALIAVWMFAYRRLIAPTLRRLAPGRAVELAPLLVATTGLVIAMRGGVQWTPLNESTVAFSRDDFANQAARNVGWNFFQSLVGRDYETQNPYTAVPADTARVRVARLLAAARGGSPRELLRVRRPNVILIIWESLTSKVVGRQGGVPGVTPHLDSLSQEGIWFDDIYATGDRSAKGLVGILSGFPALPHVQVMNRPEKAAHLPMLSRDLARAGWSTSFYYGGELEFANIKAYLLHGAFDHLIGKQDFPRRDWNSKWGAHDHVVLQRALADARAARRPFFTTIFTLSSHEPFEVPMAPVFPGASPERKFLNAHAYADRSIGAFIAAAKREPWWDSTLVVIVADHGHVLPRRAEDEGAAAWDQFHIPMLWLGGALAVRDTVITRAGSQIDLAPTVLAQMGMRPEAGAYRWGNDLLVDGGAPFTYFSYRDGFALAEPRGRVLYDALGPRVIARSGTGTEDEIRDGLSFLRLAYQDYLGL